MQDVSHETVKSSSTLTCSPARGDLYIPPIWQSASAERRQSKSEEWEWVKHTAAFVERETAVLVESNGMPEVDDVLAHWCLFIERRRRESE